MILRMLAALALVLCSNAFAAEATPPKDDGTTDGKTEEQIVKDLAKELGISEEDVKKRLKDEKDKQDQEDKEKDEKHKDLYDDKTKPATGSTGSGKTDPATAPKTEKDQKPAGTPKSTTQP